MINVRPAKLLPGITSPLVNPNDFDLLVVRENSEGEYSSVGGRIYQGEDEIAIQNAVFSRRGTERVMRYAFELAANRRKHVTSATKSNGIVHSMPFWDDIFKEVSRDYAGIETDSQHIDALAAFFVTHPERFDVSLSLQICSEMC